MSISTFKCIIIVKGLHFQNEKKQNFFFYFLVEEDFLFNKELESVQKSPKNFNNEVKWLVVQILDLFIRGDKKF
jgi:hypothetical protein